MARNVLIVPELHTHTHTYTPTHTYIHLHTCTHLHRDRAPFVLTQDMAYVINNGMASFVDLCCSAYNELRRHTHLLLSLLSLVCTQPRPTHLCMTTPTSSVHDQFTSRDDIRYVRDALLPGKSPDEATDAFKQ